MKKSLFGLLLGPALLLTPATPAFGATALVTPKPIKCHELQRNGSKVCVKKPGRVDWSKGWWADPTRYEVVDGNIYTETTWEIPSDGYKTFDLTGYVSINAGRGFKGTLKIPGRKPGVSVSVVNAKPVKGSASSEGGWTTRDGFFSCGIPEADAAEAGPTALTGVVAANPRAKQFSIQWGIYGAPVRCDDGPVSNPTIPEVSSDAFTTRYRAAAFRKGEMFKLPVRASWTTDGSFDGHVTITMGGSVVIRRIHHRIR